MSELDEVGGKMGEGLLNTSEVQTRYGFVDPRAARAIMWEAGGFDRGNRMMVFRLDSHDAVRGMRGVEPMHANRNNGIVNRAQLLDGFMWLGNESLD